MDTVNETAFKALEYYKKEIENGKGLEIVHIDNSTDGGIVFEYQVVDRAIEHFKERIY